MSPCMSRQRTLDAWALTRAGATPPSIDQSAQRARPFGAAVGQVPWAAFVTGIFDESGVSSYLICPGSDRSKNLVSTLASAVAARTQPCDPPDLTSTPVVGRLRVKPDFFAAHETQYGGDPTEVALTLSRALHPGQWMSVTMRKPSRSEIRSLRRWFAWRQVPISHYSTEAESVVATLSVGAESRTAVESLLAHVAAAIPGFELETGVDIPNPLARAAGIASLGTAAWLAASHFGYHAAGSVGGGAVESVGYLSALRPISRREVLVTPPRRTLPVRRPRQAKVNPNGSTTPAHGGTYPLAGHSMLMGPGMVLGLVSPHAGAASGIATSRQRPVPAAMSDHTIGPLVGQTQDRSPVHISSEDFYAGVGILGLPGTGKTALVHHLWAWNCATKSNGTLVAIENKGEGAAGYLKWAESFGVKAELVDLMDPATPAISLFDSPGTPGEKAARMLDAMIYHWGHNDIQGRAAEALTATLVAAFAIPSGHFYEELGYSEPLSVVDFAHILLGGDGDEKAKLLAAQVAMLSRQSPDDKGLAEATRQLAPFFESGTTPSQRRTLTESSRNKMRDFRNAGSWWSPARPTISWDEVLTEHRCVVVNTGFSPTARQAPAERTSAAVAAVLTHQLRAAIMRNCQSWKAEGRSVSIFADELALLAATSDEVVAWLRNQGRSYGVRAFFAAQYPEQLKPAVKTALLSFGTVFWFRQIVPAVTAEAVVYLASDGTEWTAADLVNLENYHAVVAATVSGKRQPAVAIAVSNWDGEPDRFLEDQHIELHCSPGGDWW